MAAIRVFDYTVSCNAVSPSVIAKGGVQGEHNATQLNFKLGTDLTEALRALSGTGKSFCYRFDGIDGLGVRYSFDAEQFRPEDEETVLSFTVGRVLTRYGGTAEIYLVITLNSDDGTEMELYSYSVKLALKSAPESESVVGENGESLSTLAIMAKNNARIAEVARVYATEAQIKTEAARAAIEQGSEWIFDGGDSTTEIQIESSIDGSMSDTSTEAVQNSVIKRYIDENVSPLTVDYITAEGTEGIWSWRKWASGTAECWGNSTAKDYAIKSEYTIGYYCEREYTLFPEGLFFSTPTVSVCFNSKNYGLPLVCISDLGKTGVSLALYEGNPSNRNGFFTVCAKGRWKE